MKVVIQHPITHHFLTSDNEWKPSVESARLFESACEAVSFGSTNVHPPYNVVLKFEDPRYDCTVSASENSGISEHRTARR